MLYRNLVILFSLVMVLCCKQTTEPKEVEIDNTEVDFSPDTAALESPELITPAVLDYNTEIWTELTKSEGYLIDLKYATKDNFTKQVIYPCGRCFVRPLLANKLKVIQEELLREKQLSIKLFDCYRPRPAQQRLWDIVPDATYVADPKKGSMHNRGSAIDMTLVDSAGNDLDMGTAFDHFGRESRHNYLDLDPKVLDNRRLLKETMVKHGFNSIKSEWWHYSLNGTGHGVSDWEWACNE